MTLQLRAAFMPNPRVLPLLDGTIEPQGIHLQWETGDAGDLHERHLRDGDHDVFEFSISNFLITRDRPRPLWDWMMLPVFASKATLGINTWVNADAGIVTGADLRGRSFGIPDYTMTAGLWFRAQVEELWGVKASEMTWYVAREGEHSHGHQMGLDAVAPPGVDMRWSSPVEVNERLQAGTIDAAFPALDVPLDTESGRLRRLFPDRGRSFFADYHAKVGFLPVNHVVLVRRSLVEREPWIAESLMDAFERSKREAYRRDSSARGVFRGGNDDMAWQGSTFGDDPHPYGSSSGKDMLAAAAAQSHRDGLTSRVHDLRDYIPESVRDA